MADNPEAVPRTLRVAAAISARFLIVAAAVVVVALLLARLRLIFLPLIVAVLLATVLVPVAGALVRVRIPRAIAAALTMLGALAVVGGSVAALAPEVVERASDLDVTLADASNRLEGWLSSGPLGISEQQVDRSFSQLGAEVRSGRFLGGALSGAFLLVELLAGAVLALVLTFFFVKDGDRVWQWIVGLFPPPRRADVAEIGERSWAALGGYVRGLTIVALFDAVFIGLALYLIGVPFVLPLAVLTFFGGFVPIVGAFVAGGVAALVALVSNGFVAALLVVAAAVTVQQLEGNLLQPYIVGRSVSLHPAAILLAVAVGGVLWGVVGAFLAVPITVVLATALQYAREESGDSGFPEEDDPGGAEAVTAQRR